MEDNKIASLPKENNDKEAEDRQPKRVSRREHTQPIKFFWDDENVFDYSTQTCEV